MANTISPNMNLVVPTVGVEPGPAWANDVNADLSILDGHDHSNGRGVQITPSGLNINAALNFQNNQATNLQAVMFTAQSSLSTLNALYVQGVDLYFNDGSGDPAIRITAGGTVNATSSGLASGTASASFVSNVLVVNSNTATPANIQAGSILLGNNVANSKFLTLSPPNSMAANYTITLPSLPSSQSILTIDNSGLIATPVVYPIPTAGIASQAVAQGNLAARATGTTVGAGGIAVSTSTASFSTSNSGFVLISTVTITTTGRPVQVVLQTDANGVNASDIELGSTTFLGEGVLELMRGGTMIFEYSLGSTGATGSSVSVTVPPACVAALDFPAAGTYTYTLYGSTFAPADTLFVTNCKLIAYEI